MLPLRTKEHWNTLKVIIILLEEMEQFAIKCMMSIKELIIKLKYTFQTIKIMEKGRLNKSKLYCNIGLRLTNLF